MLEDETMRRTEAAAAAAAVAVAAVRVVRPTADRGRRRLVGLLELMLMVGRRLLVEVDEFVQVVRLGLAAFANAWLRRGIKYKYEY